MTTRTFGYRMAVYNLYRLTLRRYIVLSGLFPRNALSFETGLPRWNKRFPKVRCRQRRFASVRASPIYVYTYIYYIPTTYNGPREVVLVSNTSKSMQTRIHMKRIAIWWLASMSPSGRWEMRSLDCMQGWKWKAGYITASGIPYPLYWNAHEYC